ncbi:Pkinase-domain-containing protein [Guyanagaster necrorhizus]|uniref:Pkinase-domain-containing protein n=1 Tax=Guyanagaster necrorhizus TaxID=856835 RepID=A0A9P7W741_9AGAR|nr:Pkinase-domain-containing protein [Guyanagaster necrorhizus MCA 3950]KAG7452486.1 Pkinase-domain-containing protein [Guyanagaster necrorhizus MCA 3950]
MSTLAAANNLFHVHDNPADPSSKPSSPSSPTSSFQVQQSVPRSFMTTVRGQSSPFPSTPTSSHSSAAMEPPPGVTYCDYIRMWTDAHVARWLADIKCGSHAATFKANDIRGDILLELDQTTLQEMGVGSIGDRFRILHAVKALRQKASSKPVTSPVLEINRSRLVTSLEDSMTIAMPSDQSVSSLTARRLESGRPAPLLLGSNPNRNDLPRLIRDQQAPDSAKANVPPAHAIRPLPQPIAGSSSSAHPGSTRSGLPPLPPPPRGQPPLPPPGRPPVRGHFQTSQSNGRRTPTQTDHVPMYTTQALPPAPSNQALLTPSPASNWSGYHLPADPRPGNPGGAKTPQAIPRSTSPLPRAGGRGTNASNPVHGRNGSIGLNSPVSSSPATKQLRLGGGSAHPYATSQAAASGSNPSQAANLSPIAEGFGATGTSPPTYAVGRGPFNPSTPSHTNAPSLDDLRRKLVKIALPDEGLTYTIDVDNCAGGVEVLEKVLKKFGKRGARHSDSEGVDSMHTEDGGLSVDGWGAYRDDGTGPLDEAALLSYCHASLDHPARDKPLSLRKIAKARREDRNSPPSPPHGRFPGGQTSKSTKRASSISILSGLGVRDPEKALEPPSPTHSGSGRSSPATTHSAKRPSKLRNFFGQRPPSELITTHLTEYFPFTEKKVLERTARHSMMRAGTTRDSASSYNPPLPSRFSSSTLASLPRTSVSTSRTSLSSNAAPPLPEKPFSDSGNTTPAEDIPRVSLSTEDGRSVNLHDTADSANNHPELLPPIPFPTESFSESLESLTGANRRMSRALSTASRASRRLSYMTELRSKKDRSDTASLMTVDEITKEVESRRRNTGVFDRSSEEPDGWTQVENEDGADENDEEPDEEEYTDSEEDGVVSGPESPTLDEDDDHITGVAMRKANKWIKGALIGAGSFGKVYLGMDASNGLLMAVKQVELPTGSAPNEERKKNMLSALEHEIELLQDLQHENIVQYLYSSLEDDCLNIFLEYVPGGSVTALLRNYGAFEEPLVKNFVRQILQGLSYLHERDIIHRDIKGANILVDNKGGVKISDFGISKKVDVQVLAGNNRVHRPSLQGSVFWMAPEVVKQSGHTQKADIWSVGCLVVEMLTGEHPWAQLTQMQAIFKIGSSARPAIPSDISSEAQDFLTEAFEIDHKARPAAAELLKHPWINAT